MVEQEKVNLIVMLTGCKEHGKNNVTDTGLQKLKIF